MKIKLIAVVAIKLKMVRKIKAKGGKVIHKPRKQKGRQVEKGKEEGRFLISLMMEVKRTKARQVATMVMRIIKVNRSRRRKNNSRLMSNIFSNKSKHISK